MYRIYLLFILFAPALLFAEPQKLFQHDGPLKLAVYKESKQSSVILSGQGLNPYTYFSLKQPQRFVLEFEQAKLEPMMKAFRDASFSLKSLKIDKKAGKTRLQLFLDEKIARAPIMSEKKGQLVIHIPAGKKGDSHPVLPTVRGGVLAAETWNGVIREKEFVRTRRGADRPNELVPLEEVPESRRQNVHAPGVFASPRAKAESTSLVANTKVTGKGAEEALVESFVKEDKGVPIEFSEDVIYLTSQRDGYVSLKNASESQKVYHLTLVEVVNPGKEDERRVATTDVDYSPRELTMGPAEQKNVRVMLKKPLELERVFELQIYPTLSSFEKKTVGTEGREDQEFAVAMGASLLILAQPRPRKARVRWSREEDLLRFINEGNISAYFHSGTSCPPGLKGCAHIPPFRIYPGNTVGIPIPDVAEVRITEELENVSKEFVLPGEADKG